MKTWVLDNTHSTVHFKVRHLVISTVTGSFRNFTGKFTAGDNLGELKAEFEAETASVDTGLEQRDNHLRSDDFFNSEKFPVLRFRSSEFEKVSDGNYNLKGDLTIRDITKPVTLQVEFGGTMVDFYGNEKAGFTVTGKINRKEFGLQWTAVTEAGGVVVSDEVKIEAGVQFTRQTENETISIPAGN